MKKILILTTILALLTCLTAYAQGTVDKTGAEDIALEAAGVTRENALLSPTESDTERGGRVWEVEFTADGKEFDYQINASDGGIVEYSWEVISPSAQDASSAVIGEAAAQEIALADAALAEDVTVNVLQNRQETDDGLRLYKLVFEADNARYEYEIDAVSGEILEKDVSADGK